VEDDPAESFVPHDVSWIDGDGDDSDGDTRVKRVSPKKQPQARRRDLHHGDLDAGFEVCSFEILIFTPGTDHGTTARPQKSPNG
jgi:hypothetical protein